MTTAAAGDHSARRVFLSYSRSDGARVRGLVALLEALGHTVFFDRRSIKAGARWQARIEAELDKADVLIVFWTQPASRSEWVRAECERFHFATPERPLIPLLGDETPLSELLASRQASDLGALINELLAIQRDMEGRGVGREQVEKAIVARLEEAGIELGDSRKRRILTLFAPVGLAGLIAAPLATLRALMGGGVEAAAQLTSGQVWLLVGAAVVGAAAVGLADRVLDPADAAGAGRASAPASSLVGGAGGTVPSETGGAGTSSAADGPPGESTATGTGKSPAAWNEAAGAESMLGGGAGPPRRSAVGTPSPPPPPSVASGTGFTPAEGAYFPGEKLRARFAASAETAADGWIALLRSDVQHGSAQVADNFDLTYEYLKGRTEGTVGFRAPTEPGSYDLRIYDRPGANGVEVGSMTFAVVVDSGGAGLELGKATYFPGEPLDARFTSSRFFPHKPWIAVIRSGVQHGNAATADAHDLSYEWVAQRTEGRVGLVAPTEPGSYDLRMYNRTGSSGMELVFVTFEVVIDHEAATLQLLETSYCPAEAIQARFTASKFYPHKPWIALVPADLQHGGADTADAFDIAYEWIAKRTEGAVDLRAPEAPGSYELRLFDRTGAAGVEVAASGAFEVRQCE